MECFRTQPIPLLRLCVRLEAAKPRCRGGLGGDSKAASDLLLRALAVRFREKLGFWELADEEGAVLCDRVCTAQTKVILSLCISRN